MKFKISARRMRYFLGLVSDNDYLKKCRDDLQLKLANTQASLDSIHMRHEKQITEYNDRIRNICTDTESHIKNAQANATADGHKMAVVIASQMLAMHSVSTDYYADIFTAIREDKKILAIKLVRSTWATLNLLQAKLIVEELMNATSYPPF